MALIGDLRIKVYVKTEVSGLRKLKLRLYWFMLKTKVKRFINNIFK